MKYDFTSIMDRHGKDAIAVDGLGTGFAPAAPKECIGYENGVLGGVISALELRLLQGRQDPDPQPHLHRLHHEPEEQRLRGCPQPAGQG